MVQRERKLRKMAINKIIIVLLLNHHSDHCVVGAITYLEWSG
jgi:hypothetical protein